MLLPFLLLLPLTLSKSIPPSTGDRESSCSFQKGDYSLSWYYDDLSSDVVFKLSAKSTLTNFWSGVLLGEEKPTDAIGVFVRSGQIGLTDAHVSDDGILADNLTDVQSLSFDLTEDKLTAEFARPLTPQDKTDADLGRCVTFFFPVSPSQINMGEPIEVPQQLESRRICDLADSCVQRDQTSLVKREENQEPLCIYKKNKQNTVTWKYEGGHYVFTFDHPVKKGKWWSSVGAGESMQEMSMAVAFSENGKVKSVGGYTSTDYKLPEKDGKNSHQVKLITSTVKNGQAHYEFSVNEDFIKEKTVDGCVTLQVAINSGQFGPNNKIRKHESLPTAIPVCGIEQCPNQPKTTQAPKSSVVDVHPNETPVDTNNLNQDGNQEQSVVDVNPTVPNQSIVDVKSENKESVVDAKPGIPAESIIDVNTSTQSAEPLVNANSQQSHQGEAAQALVDVKAPENNPQSSVVDAHPTQPAESIVDVNANPAQGSQPSALGESVIDAQNQQAGHIADVNPNAVPKESVIAVKTLPNTKQPSGHIVDTQPVVVPSQSVVDVHNQTADNIPTEEFNNDQGNNGSLVDDRIPESELDEEYVDDSLSEANETIVDFREVTQKPQDLEQIVDFHEKREENSPLANGTAEIGLEEIVKNSHGKKTTKHPKKFSSKPHGTKKPEAIPADSIVDFREEPEGSGEAFEGSGESATNETNVEENADQGENSILTNVEAETNHSRPPIVNVDGAVDPKVTPTTFSPPVSIPQLHNGVSPSASNPEAILNQTSLPTLATAPNQPDPTASLNTLPTLTPQLLNSQQTTTAPANIALVPKTCVNPEDLRICEGYFEDYLSKVREWSSKHNHTVEQSMWKACRLLSQVKHVPSMCCNQYKKVCDPYSRQYIA